jgi:hypothetical protein
MAMGYDLYTLEETFEILGRDRSTPFEFKMAFIPEYNKASLYDKIRYNDIKITKCHSIGKNTQFMEELIMRQIILYSEKIKLEHCNT